MWLSPPTCGSAYPQVAQPTHMWLSPPTCGSAHPHVAQPTHMSHVATILMSTCCCCCCCCVTELLAACAQPAPAAEPTPAPAPAPIPCSASPLAPPAGADAATILAHASATTSATAPAAAATAAPQQQQQQQHPAAPRGTAAVAGLTAHVASLVALPLPLAVPAEAWVGDALCALEATAMRAEYATVEVSFSHPGSVSVPTAEWVLLAKEVRRWYGGARGEGG